MSILSPMTDCETQRRVTVAFVRILGRDRWDFNTADHNVGLGYLAAVAEREGARVVVLDPLDIDDSPELWQHGYHDFIGFSVHHLNIAETLACAKAIRAKYPGTYILFGGHHAGATAQEILSDHPYIDGVCIGEGEELVQRLVKALSDSTPPEKIERGVLRSRHYVDLSTLPRPKRGRIEEAVRISTSRGCPYECTFCSTPAIRLLAQEPIYRTREAASVVAEMSDLFNAGATKIYINDDLFALPSARSHERAKSIAEGLLSANFGGRFKVQLRIDSFAPSDLPTLTMLHRSGLKSVFIGIESGSDSILEEFDKRATTGEIRNRLRMYDEVGIQVNAGNILASPGSTSEQICQSIRFFRDLGLAYLFFRRVTFRAHVFPGTRMERMLEATGRLNDSPRYLTRLYRFSEPHLEEVIQLFESCMPEFLHEIGRVLFRLRDRAIEQAYAERDTRSSTELIAALRDWNNASADFLLRWFEQKRNGTNTWRDFQDDYERYCQIASNLSRRLARYVVNNN